MRLLLRLLLVVTLGLVACSEPPKYPYAQEPDPRLQEYVLGVPDQVRIQVWGHGDLTTSGRIRPDGTLTMPLIGDVTAAGKTPSQLKTDIAGRLREFLKIGDDRDVTVEVVAIESYRITVMGKVRSPGVLATNHFVTVTEAITLSGGTNEFAAPQGTQILRTRPDGSIVYIPIRYDLLERGEAVEQDIVLLRGDVVLVP